MKSPSLLPLRAAKTFVAAASKLPDVQMEQPGPNKEWEEKEPRIPEGTIS